MLDLRSGVGEDLGVGIGRGSALVARVAEQIGRAPQESDAGLFLERRGLIRERVEVRAERREAVTLRSDVPVMEAVVRGADLGEELEGCGELPAGALQDPSSPNLKKDIKSS